MKVWSCDPQSTEAEQICLNFQIGFDFWSVEFNIRVMDGFSLAISSHLIESIYLEIMISATYLYNFGS